MLFPHQAAAEVFAWVAEDFHLWSMRPVTSEEGILSDLDQRGKYCFLIDFLEGCSALEEAACIYLCEQGILETRAVRL